MRNRARKIQDMDEQLLKPIKALKKEHPLWGYRRIWAYIKYRMQITGVNKKRVYRVMKENSLLVSQLKQLRALRTPRSKPKATQMNQIWGIDMTKLMVNGWGWMYLVVVLDWYTKKIVGYRLNIQSTTKDWLAALNDAVNAQFPNGIRAVQPELSLVSDNGSQPTSQRFIKESALLGINQIFASYNNPKGNADTERVIRTLKEDLVWPREWNSIIELKDRLDAWIVDYNTDYPHSSLGYMTPVEFENRQKNEALISTNLYA